MNFIIYFFIVILGYLTLAKTTSIEDYSINSIQELSEIMIEKVPPPATFVLTGVRSKGQFIKSHYLNLRAVSAFNPSKDIQVRVPFSLFEKFKNHTGLSVFNIQGDESSFENVISIPGMFFVGNPQLGKWISIEKKDYWSFYQAYLHLPFDLGWENFNPNEADWNAFKNAKEGEVVNNHPQLFGANGQNTKKLILQYRNEKKNSSRHEGLKLIRSYFKFNI